MTLNSFDPRRHLAAAIGWSTFVIVTIAAVFAATVVANVAESQARTDVERLLTQFAIQTRQSLAMSLEIRRAIVQTTAAQIVSTKDRGTEALRLHLEAVQAQFPEFAWLGVADPQGRVVAATGAVLYGENVAEQQWFRQARRASFLGDVRVAPLPEQRLIHETPGRTLRVIDIASPIIHPGGANVGVLGAQLYWDWIDKHQRFLLLQALDSQRPLQLILVAEDATVLVGPTGWLGKKLDKQFDFTERGAYLVGRPAVSPPGDKNDLDWTIVVRQSTDAALAPARTTRRFVFLTVLLAGLASALAAVATTRALTRRLAMLSDSAMAVQQGLRNDLVVPVGANEVSRIGAVLAETIGYLQREKEALATLNADLDAQVAERSERLASETRHAAVVRERLRLARDLHDTLAHSLMALITQIRLIRKLRLRFSADELDAELATAEQVSVSGLAGARAAITQIRHNSVLDIGLGAALKELIARFAERSGVAATLEAEVGVVDLANERTETVFRIVEEALRNVERHAQASSVRISLSEIGNPAARATEIGQHIRVEIIDDGVGFDVTTTKPGHYGLLGIREQAELIGARLSLHSNPGEGTRLVLEFDS